MPPSDARYGLWPRSERTETEQCQDPVMADSNIRTLAPWTRNRQHSVHRSTQNAHIREYKSAWKAWNTPIPLMSGNISCGQAFGMVLALVPERPHVILESFGADLYYCKHRPHCRAGACSCVCPDQSLPDLFLALAPVSLLVGY